MLLWLVVAGSRDHSSENLIGLSGQDVRVLSTEENESGW